MTPPRVLVVEDNADIRDAVVEFLGAHGFRITGAPDAIRALDAASLEPYDVVIADYNLAGMTGVELADAIRQSQPNIRLIVMSGDASIAGSVQAPDLFLAKPTRLPLIAHAAAMLADH